MAIVVVALSGGVDSAVAAALLKEQGHTVIAVHMLTGFLDSPEGGGGGKHADRIARALNIPFHVWDLSGEFKSEVVDYFVCTYSQGRTPNPCVVCNPRIKFGIMMHRALDMGAERLATGHYARISRDAETSRVLLLKGVDPTKDQSYFLHRLHQDQLARAVFPLGEKRKSEVRELAARLGLSELVSAESQEFCFMGENNYKDFVETTIAASRGDLVDTAGNVLGRHQGVHRYTIGQRRGLNLPSTEPYYVVAIDPSRNRVVIGRRGDLLSREMTVEGINWIVPPSSQPFRCSTRIRFRHREAPSTVTVLNESEALVVFDSEVRAITPGQAAVFYDGDIVLGGGWIRESRHMNPRENG